MLTVPMLLHSYAFSGETEDVTVGDVIERSLLLLGAGDFWYPPGMGASFEADIEVFEPDDRMSAGSLWSRSSLSE